MIVVFVFVLLVLLVVFNLVVLFGDFLHDISRLSRADILGPPWPGSVTGIESDKVWEMLKVAETVRSLAWSPGFNSLGGISCNFLSVSVFL